MIEIVAYEIPIKQTGCVVGVVHTYSVSWKEKGLELSLRTKKLKKKMIRGVIVNKLIENFGEGDGGGGE